MCSPNYQINNGLVGFFGTGNGNHAGGGMGQSQEWATIATLRFAGVQFTQLKLTQR